MASSSSSFRARRTVATLPSCKELARCFTGWNIFSVTTDANFGDFRFKHWNHDGGSKVVLGQTIPGGGVEEAAREKEDVVRVEDHLPY